MAAIPGDRDISGWLAGYVGELVCLPVAGVDLDATFDSYGLDSAAAIGITGELQQWLGIRIDPHIVDDYPTIRSLSAHLAAVAAGPDMVV